ncbi:MAG: hypothetical protein QW540_07440 [Archaeoglobaceae archaeon]
MEYEYIYLDVEKLKKNPLKADHIMRLAEEVGLKPIVARVDNYSGQVFFYFDKHLENEDKEKLDKLVDKLFKELK